MKAPRISVGLPVYNGDNFISRSIESILAQDFEDFELIISDNASLDKTGFICQSYAMRDQRIRYFRNETNIGAALNHNRVFELARGKYFKWAAHDDECLPRMLSRCFETLEAAPSSVTLVYPHADLINDKGKILGVYSASIESRDPRPRKRLAKVLDYTDLGVPMYGLMRTDILRKTRLIDSFVGSDYVLLAELELLGEIWKIPEVLLLKRLHPARAMEANKTRKAGRAWHNPLKGNKLDFLGVGDRLILEYLRSIFRSELQVVEKVLSCLMALFLSSIQRKRLWRWRSRAVRLWGGYRPAPA